MIQLAVSANHVIKAYSRAIVGTSHKLQVINKGNGLSAEAVINSASFLNGVVTIDFDYQTKEAGQYYLIFSSLNVTYKENFKSMAFASATTEKVPYQNIEINNGIA